ncbi:hypothetical protein [Solibacillus merdavium]|uniref:DUF4234 domain-containing protein n=1 Tax=Solibacillus merdavium TaxID=2762218 RepID=A0ABR8XLW1_9BACL|nr:hypothetical protein [Solibacillus merdavium]MBD8032926.1 hypothetical protein [Solibacillus merdavium]
MNMKRAYELSEIGKMKFTELLTFLIVFIFTPLIIKIVNNLFNDALLILILIPIISVVIFLIIIWKREKGTKKYPTNYWLILFLLLFSYMDLLIIILINNPNLTIYGLVIASFLYLYIFGILFYYFMNFLFMFRIKKMFPSEADIEKNQVDDMSLKKLSKYIDIDNQKMYYSLSLINFAIYMGVVYFGMLLLIKNFTDEKGSVFEQFSSWVKEQEYVTLFNGIAIFSLLITIYNITIPIQKRIIKNAREKVIEKNKEYFNDSSRIK